MAVKKPIDVIDALATANQTPKKRGGRRPGAGRKPNVLKKFNGLVDPVDAALILQTVEANKVFFDLLHDRSSKIRLETIIYLTDRAYGRPTQRNVNENKGQDANERITGILAAIASGTAPSDTPKRAN